MSDVPAKATFSARIAGHWQVPLLLVSLGLLAAGVWRLRPAPQPPSFEQLYAQAVRLRESQLYPEASRYIEQLLADPQRRPEQRRRLHALLADVIFAHEMGNSIHGPANARALLENTELALAPGEAYTAAAHYRRALAFEWLRNEREAVSEYQQAVAKGIEHPWMIRKRILEIEQVVAGLSIDDLLRRYDPFVSEEGVPEELRYWAADQKVTALAGQKRFKEAEQVLFEHARRFLSSPLKGEYDYLQAKMWYYLGRLDDAERLLRSQRDELVPGRPLYARSGWLLGRILQARESPEFARTFYDDVIQNTTPGPYRVASMLGRAEVLAQLDRHEEAVAAFEETIRLTTEDPYGSLVDLLSVRASTTLVYEELLRQEKLAEAMGYLKVAARLVGPADAAEQAKYAERLAALSFKLGEMYLKASESGEVGAGGRARESFVEAAGHYLRLAKLTSLDGAKSTTATWHAADAYDNAADRRAAANVLEVFLQERPLSVRAPEALLRLGQTYQSQGMFEEAILKYQQNLLQHPNVPFAVRSLVPLAECFIATGQLDKAEDTLLRMIEHRPGDELALVEPSAAQYRDALFKLGDLYVQAGQHEKAIARYEEAVERYPTDPRTGQITYLLAEAYRKSALRIREDIEDPANAAYREDLRNKYGDRLRRAAGLYGQVIDRYQSVPEASMSDLQRLQIKLSYFQRADMIYDQTRVAGMADVTAYAEALDVYDRAAWVYQNDPMTMSAYVQMMTCHLRMGNVDRARMVLQRARWALKGISDEQFERGISPLEGREFWEEYLTWLERTPTFMSPTTQATG